MKDLRKGKGFTLIELLVVILILAVLMAIALPLYLRAVRDSQRQTCRSNMQTIANAEQAYRLRSPGHVYTTDLAGQLVGTTEDLQAVPQCPNDSVSGDTDDYTVEILTDAGGMVIGITVRCNCDDVSSRDFHNSPTDGFTPGVDAE